MYVLVHHTVHDPEGFWGTANEAGDPPPNGLVLHQTLSAKDGTRATCLWEGDSVKAVRDYLESVNDGVATNEYSEAENREGIVFPARFGGAAQP